MQILPANLSLSVRYIYTGSSTLQLLNDIYLIVTISCLDVLLERYTADMTATVHEQL